MSDGSVSIEGQVPLRPAPGGSDRLSAFGGSNGGDDPCVGQERARGTSSDAFWRQWFYPQFFETLPPPQRIAGELADLRRGVRAVVRRTGAGPLGARFRAGREASRAGRIEDAHGATSAGLYRWYCLLRAGIVSAAAPSAASAEIEQVAWNLRRTTTVESHTKIRMEGRRWWAHALAAVLALVVVAVATGNRFHLSAWQIALFGIAQASAWLTAAVFSDRLLAVGWLWALIGAITGVVLNAVVTVAEPVVVVAAIPLVGVTIIVGVLLIVAGAVLVHPWVPRRWQLHPDPYAVLLNSLVDTAAGLSNVRRMDDPNVWHDTMQVPYWWNGLSKVPNTDEYRRLHEALQSPVAQIVTSPQLTNELHNALVACVGDLCPRRDGDDWRLGGQRDALPDQSYPGPVWSLNPETLKTASWNAQLLVWELGRAAAALEEGFPADGPDARRRLKTLGHEVACWVRDRQLDLQQPGPHVVDRVEPMLVQAIFDVVAGRWEDLKSTGPAAIPWPERIGRRAPSALMGAALAGGAVWLWISGEQLAAVALASPALALLKSDDLATAAASALDDVRKIAKH